MASCLFVLFKPVSNNTTKSILKQTYAQLLHPNRVTERHRPEHVEDDNDEDDDQQERQGHHDCYDWHVNGLGVVFRDRRING